MVSPSVLIGLPVYYDRLEHSPWQHTIPYLRNYTMYQQFCIKNSTTNSTTNFTQNATWSHDHHSLSDPSLYHINNPLHPYWKDGRQCVNTSITLLNNVTELDHGVYTVVVSTNCGSQSNMNFTLQISPCGVKYPRPVNPTRKPVIVSDLKRPPSLSFQFEGDSKKSDYTFYLMKSSETLCTCTDSTCEDSARRHLHISCCRDIRTQCDTNLTVHFLNFTNQDLGEYCVAVFLIGSDSIGNTSCVELGKLLLS